MAPASDIFLGGSCNPTTWRKDLAIPEFRKAGITFFNPQVDNWSEELVALEAKAKKECACLFFVIDRQSRSLSSMVECAEYIAKGRNIVLVIEQMPAQMSIRGVRVSDEELKDNNRARVYLKDVAERNGAPVFADIGAGLRYVVEMHRRCGGRLPAERPSSAGLRALSFFSCFS
eukprot:tig00020909_g15351.t1